MPVHDVLFGASLGQWNGADAADAAGRIRLGTQADRDGLDLFTVADHPYFGDKLDAGPADPCLLCGTRRRSGAKSEGRVRVTLKAVGSAFPRKRLWNRAQDEDVMKSFVLSDGWPVNIT